jgi:hypothetical protein
MTTPVSAGTWKKLAEYSRSLAEASNDPRTQTCLYEIAMKYEALAQLAAAPEDAPGPETPDG